MNAIVGFCCVNKSQISSLSDVFQKIKEGKLAGQIAGDQIKVLLGDSYQTMFWHPTLEEKESWERLWFSTLAEERSNIPELKKT